jgi:mTERF
MSDSVTRNLFHTHTFRAGRIDGGLRQRARRSYAHAASDRQFNDIDLPMHQPSRSQKDAFMSSNKIAYLHQLGFADPVKMVTSFPEIAGLASDNVRRKIADLRELGFADPIKMITYFPPILGLRIDNIRGRIADLHDLGFADPVKMVTLNPAILGLAIKHPRQDHRPARARLRRPPEDSQVKPGDPRLRDRKYPRQGGPPSRTRLC